MTQQLTLFLVCVFEIGLILSVAAWTAWDAEPVRSDWNTQTARLVTNGEIRPAAETKSLWTIYEFTDDNTMIGTGTYSFVGLRMEVWGIS